MPMLDADGHEAIGWPLLAEDAEVPAEGPVLLDLVRFRKHAGRAGPTGVVLEGATPHEVLDEVAPRAAAIAIRFPLFRDGRGFTLIRRLRERLGYAGPVIALGHVLPDQWAHLRRLGASGVQLADDADIGPWRKATTSDRPWYADHFRALPVPPERFA